MIGNRFVYNLIAAVVNSFELWNESGKRVL